MSRSRFIDLANAFCTLANIDQPASIVEGNAIEVDGVDFFLQYDEQFSPDHLMVYCDFGNPPAGRLLEAYQALLERCSPEHAPWYVVPADRKWYARLAVQQLLLEHLRGGADYREPRTIDVHVRHLREKIEQDPHEPELILTVRGVGYRFRDR